MICPTCQTNFYPHMNNVLIGKNGKNNSIFAYYQMCPECRTNIRHQRINERRSVSKSQRCKTISPSDKAKKDE
jgi:phage terminase large subunit GpA-like protein